MDGAGVGQAWISWMAMSVVTLKSIYKAMCITTTTPSM